MKTKTQTHTPGPWHVEPKQEDHGASLVICDTVEGILAVIPPLNEDDEPNAETAKRGPHDAANAALMASAPELLAMLKNAEASIELVRCLDAGEAIDTEADNMLDSLRSRICAAIAKAKAAQP